jgi:glycosyl hydrolase family 123
MYRWIVLSLAAIPIVLSTLRPPPPRFEWWTTNALEKIRPYDTVPDKLPNSVHISAARNEFESFQIVFRADLDDLEGLDLQTTDLKGPEGAVLSANNVAIYFVRYLDLPKPSSIEGGSGEWPDALIPRVDRYSGEKRNAFPFKLLRRYAQPIWVEVYVPPSTAAGTYRGDLIITLDGKREAAVPITLDVWSFALPSTSSLPNTFGLNGLTAVRQHLGKYTNDDDVIRFTSLYRKAALWHRLSTHTGSMLPPRVSYFGNKVSVDWTRYDKEVSPFLDGTAIRRGEPLYGAKATSIDVPGLRAIRDDEQKVLYLRAFADHFREKGWFDRLFNYLWDEPKPDDYAEVIRQGKLAHSAVPDLKNLVTASFHSDWTGSVDIFVPLINCFAFKPGNLSNCDQQVEQRKMPNLWGYQSCASHGCNIVGGEYFRGWPSYMIDVDAVANRIMPWIVWKYNIRGELYYAMNEAYSHKEDAWDHVFLFGGNGDGTLFYPGRPRTIGGTTDIPVESIRLKLIRDGLEDYEYLVLLANEQGHDAAEPYVDRLVTNVYTYDRHPEKLYEVRREVGERLSHRRGKF